MNGEICSSPRAGDGRSSFSALVAKRMESLLMEKWQYDAEFPDHVKPLSRPEMRQIAAGAVVEELCAPLSMNDCIDAIDTAIGCGSNK